MTARAHAARTTATRRRPAARRKPGARTAASRIQWDRVGRVALTLVLAAVIYSYLNPLYDFVKTYTGTSDARVKLHEVLKENKQLHARIQSSGEPLVIEAKARKQGMVRPGETPIVVRRESTP